MKRDSASHADIHNWLAACRDFIDSDSSGLLPLFDLYAAEASNGYLFIKDDLDTLPRGASILEIGAGAMLLSCFLQQSGYRLNALEPSGIGFSHFDQLRDLVLQHAQHNNAVPIILPTPAETLEADSCFDFAFSINVMEHVTDIPLTLERIVQALCSGGRYHFTCPNYFFPYEPHFNIPTLFSKKLTETFFSKKIFSNKNLHDPVGIWKSLNWINTFQLSTILQQYHTLQSTLNKNYIVTVLERITVDKEFAARRSPMICKLISLFVKTGLHRMTSLLPAFCLPVIDCTVIRLPNETLVS